MQLVGRRSGAIAVIAAGAIALSTATATAATPTHPTPASSASSCTHLGVDSYVKGADAVNLRSHPSTGSTALASLLRGTTVRMTCLTSGHGWVHVDVTSGHASGRTGWMAYRYASKSGCLPKDGC